MNKNELLNKIYKKQNEKIIEKINMLKSNEKINMTSREICKQSIELAKNNLNSSLKNEEKKNNLYQNIKKNIDKYNKMNNIKYNCNICKDNIIVNGKICNCFRIMVKESWLESLDGDLPLNLFKFHNFDLKYYSDKFDEDLKCSPKTLMKYIFGFCFNYSKSFSEKSENLLFTGGTGLGKTHLSSAIANEVARKGFDVTYISFPKEIIENNKSITESFSTQKKLNSKLLIIDDLGMEYSTSFTNSFLYNVINTRIMKELKTILVTNLSVKDIEKRYGSTILSRIIGNYLKFTFIGNDIRQKIREQKNRKER